MEIVESSAADNEAQSEVLLEITPLNPSESSAVIKDDLETIHENVVSPSESFVAEPGLIKAPIKNPRMNNSALVRAQRKVKKEEPKSDVQYAHKLGSMPKYLQKRKEASLASSVVTIDGDRPQTVDSSMMESKESKKLLKISKGDVKSIKSHGNITLNVQKTKSNISVLKRQNETLKSECEKLKTTLNDANDQTKCKSERIKQLELQISELKKEVKQKSEISQKLYSAEIEIANLKRSNENLSSRLKIKDEEIKRIKNETEKLSNDFEAQKSSVEALETEKAYLRKLIDSAKNGQGDESNKLTAMESEINSLRKQLLQKSEEALMLKKNVSKLADENSALKSSSKSSKSEEISQLEDKIHSLRKSEEKKIQEMQKLHSMLEDEKNANISNMTLLNLRAEYIKTLQETDDINKIRLTSQAEELLSLRKKVKEFDKFRAAHAEEKKNFENFLNELREEKVKLEAERNYLEETLKKKSYKYQNRPSTAIQ